MVDKNFCMSSYLAFRYIERDDMEFYEGLRHKNFVPIKDKIKVSTADEIDAAIENNFANLRGKKLGLLLSGGMDSAILASYMPGCDAYTFRFLDETFRNDELERAEYYAKIYGLKLHYVDINWQTIEPHVNSVMLEKGAPVHSIEPQLVVAANQAKADGIDCVVIGDGSDYVFGGMDRLLSRDWSFNEFVKRYTYVEPADVLNEPVDMKYLFERYRQGDGIDWLQFLYDISTDESYASYANAFETAKIDYADPYANLVMSVPLDLYRVRHGEPKYLIRELFAKKYPNFPVPEKVSMPRPVDTYFAEWHGPTRREFKPNLDMTQFTGNQKWQLWCLERFLNLFDSLSAENLSKKETAYQQRKSERKSFCLSSFLMYRYVYDDAFDFGLPRKNVDINFERTPIANGDELIDFLRAQVKAATADGKAALALSGGIDSAILAKFMPEGSTAYTFRCLVPGKKVIDESVRAAHYAEICRLNHKVVDIYWEDVEAVVDKLMLRKGAPIHSIETQIFIAAQKVLADGFPKFIFGETADAIYGGHDGLMSKDWLFGEFIERYSYIMPYKVLKNPQMPLEPFKEFEVDGHIDPHDFMERYYRPESLGSYVNACAEAKIELIAPYSLTRLANPIDYKKIRSGEPKYIVREAFRKLYPDEDMPKKTPMPRPVNEWFENWQGPTREEFLPHCQETLNGNQRWMVWALERFLNLLDKQS